MLKQSLLYKQAKEMSKKRGEEYHVDHIIPLSIGGAHHQDNMRVITAKENLEKHDKYIPELGGIWADNDLARETKKKLGIKEDRRLYVETIAGLKKKAEKSGMPYSILKKVYDRGMAAWKSGHRPGASQQQWAFARVNSFVTKSSGTWGGADKDLAKQVRGSK